MQKITLCEAQTIFFDHIRKVIFEEHELRSLQSLLRDYSSIIAQYGFPVSGVKSSYIKDILTREFDSRIGFYSRQQMNHSDLVYDMSGGGSYIEAALSSIDISSEQLVQNVARRTSRQSSLSHGHQVLRSKRKSKSSLLFCCSYYQLYGERRG